ncbi:16652_t:CDS:2, partial [Gigaspora margarita]
KNDDEGSTSKEKNLKQKESKLSLEMVLRSLAYAYLEVLKNLSPELTKSEEPEPQQESVKMDREMDKTKRISSHIIWNKEEMKGPTRPGLTKSKKALNIGCYQDGISVKRNKMLKGHSRPVKYDDSNGQFDPSRLYCQNGIDLRKAYED